MKNLILDSVLVLSENFFSEIRQIILSNWKNESIKGTLWLGWVCFLDLQLTRNLDATNLAFVTKEMESLKKQWFTIYGMKAEIYDFLRSLINNVFAKANTSFPGIFTVFLS